jgi:inositol phosphorylceramide mannosyltransferase catalytic subunit
MSLSICMLTADPAARIAAILEPLRPYAEEIVIAADSRVDDETLAGYGRLADRLFRIEFVQVERHMAWLCERCHGDWIMRLDGDEVPSGSFLRRLPGMLASRRVQQFWSATAWVFPDANTSLAQPPWSDDFAVRLMRNDGTLRVLGVRHRHAEPVAPREYVAEPFYHLDLLVNGIQARRDKVIRYEASHPRLSAPGGGRFNEAYYLPELRETLALRRVPDEDRETIARALAMGPTSAGSQSTPAISAENVPFVSLEDMDRTWGGRELQADDYRASIDPPAPTLSLAPDEQRHIVMRVRNEGHCRWPASLDERPSIRLSYRWLHPDGRVHTAEGPRSAFPRRVDPGELVLTPLHVNTPEAAGSYILEVDVVHEDVRWFGCDCRVPVTVETPRGLPPVGARLGRTRPPRMWRRIARGVRIPSTIHRVWLGESPMPDEYERFGETFAQLHPDWEMRLWTDDDLTQLGIGDPERKRVRTRSELANLMRYEVLHRYGGVYVDTDVECLRPLTKLLRGIDAFAALEVPERVGNAILGSVPDHPAFERAARLARQTLATGTHSAEANGPYFLSLILEQDPDVAIFGAELFYPYLWDEPERRHETFPDAYTVHHWAQSWLGETKLG